MASDVKWIKITTDVFDDEKMLMIEGLPSADSIIVIWFKLLIFAGKQNNDGVFIMNNRIAYTDEMLASIFRRDVNTVRFALQTFQNFGMIEMVDDVITIPNWNKHQTLDVYEKKKERDRLYKAKRRAEQRALIEQKQEVVGQSSDSRRTSDDKSLPVAVSEEEIEEEIEKDKDINKKHSASDNAPSKKDISDFFEQIWLLYPCKKGKGQVSDSKKKTLFNIGLEEMTRAIERYKDDLAKEDWRKPQNGSTFFNSGYVDYLDANYTPLEPKKQTVTKRNAFNNFEGRTYDMKSLEAQLLNANKPKEHNDP